MIYGVLYMIAVTRMSGGFLIPKIQIDKERDTI